MSDILKLGQVVRAETSGCSCTVEQFLGAGGQGEVYRARLDGAKQVALKWYYPQSATAEQRAILSELVKRPAPSNRFLWPIDLVSSDGVPGFGYIMPLREPRFKSIVDLMKRRADPSMRALITAGFELAHSFRQLHTCGLCYRDISFGNAFFDPDSGEVLICDNDNITIDGQGPAGVLGTPRFMAPEVVRGEAAPSTRTDLHSLAVLLFYMLMVNHPLEGKQEAAIKCLDLPAMKKLYGDKPVFIFDPENDSNRPDPSHHKNALANWPVYPQFLRDLFIKAFTEGIRDPVNGRVRESEWELAMVRLRDAIFYCASCNVENLYDPETVSRSGGRSGNCWACGRALRLPPRLRLGRHVIMLNHDTVLFPHHLDTEKLYDFSRPVASMSRHPSDPNRWGLQNLSTEKWVLTTSDGRTADVLPGRAAMLVNGAKINFGKIEGEIRL